MAERRSAISTRFIIETLVPTSEIGFTRCTGSIDLTALLPGSGEGDNSL